MTDHPLTGTVALRWVDTDQYGHVNNVAIVRLLEEARVRLFGLPGLDVHTGAAPLLTAALGDGSSTVVVGQQVEYAREIVYRGQSLDAEGWIARLGTRSITLALRLLQEGQEHVVATVTVVVLAASAAGGSPRPRPLSDDERLALGGHVDAPPVFR
jgi:acyl-CoA thioester hydrolase